VDPQDLDGSDRQDREENKCAEDDDERFSTIGFSLNINRSRGRRVLHLYGRPNIHEPDRRRAQ
ncbi:MAG TPA: hypothetical protein PLR49_07205, partial [Deltaproteobacteria bacterium]|nr:hypothetical protein [Deltaproteobacteria bacterium]